jgi:hypothetical protein
VVPTAPTTEAAAGPAAPRRAGGNALPALAARGAVVVACIVAVLVFAHRRGDAVSCDHARTALFSAGLRHAAPAATVRTVLDTCRDPEQIAVAAAGVTSSGHPEVAATMARAAIDRGPREFAAWAALWQATRRNDPAEAARAARRAEALNPRWRPPTRTPAPAGVAGSAGP